jgi:hypothetical protein
VLNAETRQTKLNGKQPLQKEWLSAPQMFMKPGAGNVTTFLMKFKR